MRYLLHTCTKEISVRQAFDKSAEERPQYAKDVLDSFIDMLHLGECEDCGPVEVLAPIVSTCLKCQKDKCFQLRRRGNLEGFED